MYLLLMINCSAACFAWLIINFVHIYQCYSVFAYYWVKSVPVSDRLLAQNWNVSVFFLPQVHTLTSFHCFMLYFTLYNFTIFQYFWGGFVTYLRTNVALGETFYIVANGYHLLQQCCHVWCTIVWWVWRSNSLVNILNGVRFDLRIKPPSSVCALH